MQFSESLLLHALHETKQWKFFYIEIWYGWILHTGKQDTRNAEIKQKNCYMCKNCHSQLQPKWKCVCCNTDVHTDICKMYNKVDSDFSSFVVS